MSSVFVIVPVVIGVILLAFLVFACWKGEKVGRKAHLPFRDARHRRKMAAIHAAEEGRYTEGWAPTELRPYPAEAPGSGLAADLGNDGERTSTPPPAYFPWEVNKGPPAVAS